MFNFTTQTVFNEINTSGPKTNLIDHSGDSKVPSLRIGNTRFDAADIESIAIASPTVEQLASVTFDMEDILIPQDSNDTERTARIVLYVGLSMSSQDSFYSNDLVYKGKPLYIEFAVKKTDNAATVANRVKAVANKYLLLTAQDKILNISIDTDTTTPGSETGTVTISGVNGYQQLKKAVLQVFDPAAKTIDCCANQGEYVDVVVGKPVIYTVSGGVVKTTTAGGDQFYLNEAGEETALVDGEVAILPGIEAFGDYNWIIHNLRLPTLANTNFWAVTKEEMPVPGQVYTQFIIRLKRERDGIMGEIVGARGTSVTTHVLYVAGDYNTASTPANTVYTKLDTLKHSAISSTADTKAANPFGTSQTFTA